MAFRNRRRTFRRRRNPIGRMVAKAKNARFERRVKAIAQLPVETKSWTRQYDLRGTIQGAGYSVGNSFMIRSNIFREIPRADTAMMKNEKEVIGNQLEARGFWIRVNVLGSVVNNPARLGIDWRVTVYSTNNLDEGAPLIEPVFNDDSIFDPDYRSSYATAYRFNTQDVNILASKKFSANFLGGNGNFSREVKLWVPIRGRKTARAEETVLAQSNFGFLKGRNYYWLLEGIAMGVNEAQPNAFTDTFFGNIETRVYFKDA